MMNRCFTVDLPPGRFRVFLNGKLIPKVISCRAGSNGWVDAYREPLRVNHARDDAERLPRQRGHVKVEPYIE
jgi:hypothetical protein